MNRCETLNTAALELRELAYTDFVAQEAKRFADHGLLSKLLDPAAVLRESFAKATKGNGDEQWEGVREAVIDYGVFNLPVRLFDDTDEGITMRRLIDRAALRLMHDMIAWIENNRNAVRG